jgi:hypothetical protein
MPPCASTDASQAREAGFAAEILRSVRFRAALLAGVVERGGLEREEVCRLEFGPRFGQRMLDALVLADGTAEHDAFLRVLRRALQCARKAEADRFHRKQHALRIEALQQNLEALPLFADQRQRSETSRSVDEERVALHRLAAHFRDRLCASIFERSKSA